MYGTSLCGRGDGSQFAAFYNDGEANSMPQGLPEVCQTLSRFGKVGGVGIGALRYRLGPAERWQRLVKCATSIGGRMIFGGRLTVSGRRLF